MNLLHTFCPQQTLKAERHKQAVERFSTSEVPARLMCFLFLPPIPPSVLWGFNGKPLKILIDQYVKPGIPHEKCGLWKAAFFCKYIYIYKSGQFITKVFRFEPSRGVPVGPLRGGSRIEPCHGSLEKQRPFWPKQSMKQFHFLTFALAIIWWHWHSLLRVFSFRPMILLRFLETLLITTMVWGRISLWITHSERHANMYRWHPSKWLWTKQRLNESWTSQRFWFIMPKWWKIEIPSLSKLEVCKRVSWILPKNHVTLTSWNVAKFLLGGSQVGHT